MKKQKYELSNGKVVKLTEEEYRQYKDNYNKDFLFYRAFLQSISQAIPEYYVDARIKIEEVNNLLSSNITNEDKKLEIIDGFINDRKKLTKLSPECRVILDEGRYICNMSSFDEIPKKIEEAKNSEKYLKEDIHDFEIEFATSKNIAKSMISNYEYNLKTQYNSISYQIIKSIKGEKSVNELTLPYENIDNFKGEKNEKAQKLTKELENITNEK